MTTKTIVLDTNVLLSDPGAIFSFEENNVVLPLIVIEELDRHKDRQDEVGRNARETIRKLSALIEKNKDLKNGILLENGGTLRILSTEDLKILVDTPVELEMTSGDNQIISFCRALQKIEKNLILVSRDILLRTKGVVLGIHCEDYRKEIIIKNTDEAYRGARTIELTDKELDNFYNNTKYFLPDYILEKENLYPNEFLILKSTESSKSAIGRFVNNKKYIKKIDENKNAWSIKSKNKEQTFLLDLLYDDDIKLVTVSGLPGSGKTLLSIASGLDQVIGTKKYKKLIISRSIQSVGPEMGFLPGNFLEKIEPYIQGFKDNLEFLLNENVEDAENKGAVYKKNKRTKDSFMMKEFFDKGIIQVEAVSFIRGRSIPNCFIIIDEGQNLSLHEVKTIITRMGQNSKLIICGDTGQIDCNHLTAINNGLSIVVEKFKNEEISGHITMVKGERSALASIASTLL